MDQFELLAGSDLFGAFDSEALRRLLAGTSERAVQEHEHIFDQEDAASQLFVVTNGRVALWRRCSESRESLVALVEAGDVFGEMPFFDGEARSSSARALEPSTVLVMPYAVLREELQRHPHLVPTLLRHISRRLRTAECALAEAAFMDVPGRTAERLLELAGDSDIFTLPVSHDELAGLIGASRDRVDKAIAGFARLGWIDQFDRHYTILERERLAQRAQRAS